MTFNNDIDNLRRYII